MRQQMFEGVAGKLGLGLRVRDVPDGWEKVQVAVLEEKELIGACTLELMPGCCGVVVMSYPAGRVLRGDFIEALMDAGKQFGYTMWMVTMVEKERIEFFKECGFKELGVFQNFFHTLRGGNYVSILGKSAFEGAETVEVHEWDMNVKEGLARVN